MPIVGAFILPHPPIILPEVGRGEETKIEKTINSYNEIAKKIAELKPDTIILTSPHSVMYADYFHISPKLNASGDFESFGAPDVKVKVNYDTEFVINLMKKCDDEGIYAGTLGEKASALDHGTMIPLTFVNKYYKNYKLVRIGLSGMPYAEHYRLGMCIKDVADKTDKKIVFIASGDLSHKVSDSGPYGYAKEGVDFDKQITEAMSKGDFFKFLTFNPDFAEKAAECGLRSFIIMAGALDGVEVKAELLSYEGTFGVGYGVASFIPQKDNPDRKILNKFNEYENNRIKAIKDNEDDYVRLARLSLEIFVKTGTVIETPENLSDDLMKNKAGVFVSIKKSGNLRGCIGTVLPTTASIAEEIIQNALSACSEDPRFYPVSADELKDLIYSVDVLTAPEPIISKNELDAKKYGVIVKNNHKSGLLLPDLEGIDTVDQQIAIALQKAGIKEDEAYKLERFEVIRHK